MSEYSEMLIVKAETLDPDDDDYEESLLQTASLFRGFDEALTAFISEHGYTGERNDIGAKAKLLLAKYKAAGVTPPRSFKEWFSPNKRLERKTVIPVCFAFNLDIEEANDFLRCVQFDRGLDCHTVSEAVYYFCIKNSLSYSDAREIINRIPVPKKVKTIPKRDVLYTGTIIKYIDSIDDKEKLIQYITDNIGEFEYNNVTAIKDIQELWTGISKKDGLAVKEGAIIDRMHNRFKDKSKKGNTDTRLREVIVKEVKHEEEAVKPEDFVVAKADASTWNIFSQIIGLDNATENKYAVNYDRSLSSVLSQNALLPLNASYCFPSQHSIDKLIRGELSDNELIRKMLIFLVFYTFWAKKITDSNDPFYTSHVTKNDSDAERCMDTINTHLVNAGYPAMYAGNPYDWVFMWSLNNEHPLEAFRTYMGEVLAFKKEHEDTDD